MAYSKVCILKWSGEVVDVSATEVRRLAGLPGFSGSEVEKVVRFTFIKSFSNNIGTELLFIEGVDTMALSDILKRARVLTTNRGSGNVRVRIGATAMKQSRRDEKGGEARGGEKGGFTGKCFISGGAHMAKSYPDKKIRYYRCGREDHLS